MRRIKAAFNLVFRRKQIDIVLKSVEFKDSTANVVLQHPEFAHIANELGKFFIAAGGKNYVELTLFDPATIGMYTLNMQKIGGKTPSMINEELRTELEAERETRREWGRQRQDALDEARGLRERHKRIEAILAECPIQRPRATIEPYRSGQADYVTDTARFDLAEDIREVLVDSRAPEA